jgi:hypothetical protein
MSNTAPLDPNQGGTPAPGPSAADGPAASASSSGVQAPTGIAGAVGNFLAGLAEDWRKDRELKRELKRAQADAQAARMKQPLVAEDEEQEDEDGDEDDGEPTSSEEQLRRERNKRIQMISEFTDVRETFDHKIKRYVASAACFVVPWLLVFFVTGDVGQYFAGQPFTLANWQVASIFGITFLLECVLAVVTNAWGNTIHDLHATDVQQDKAKLRQRAWTQAGAWAILSLVSGFALYMFLMQQAADNAAIANRSLTMAQVVAGIHATVTYQLSPVMINIILRVLGTLAIDPACVFAVHITSKNLDQFLRQQAQITTAITEVAEAFDKQEEAAARAEMRRRENERFLSLKSKMDDVNAEMMGKMGTKLIEMSDQMFERMQLPPGRIVDADDDDEGRNVRRLRR